MNPHSMYFIKEITNIDLEREYFQFPSDLVNIYLDAISNQGKVNCSLDNSSQLTTLNYNKYGRLYIGKSILKKWFSKILIKHRRFLKVEKIENKYLRLVPLVESNKVKNPIKGEIGELGIIQLIYSCGMGYIHCYRPVKDMEGIDIILNMEYKRIPIYLQIKCGFSQNGKISFRIKPKVEDFTPSDNFFIICLLFDLEELDFFDYLYIIPSTKLSDSEIKKHIKISKHENKEYYYLNSNLKNPNHLSKYRINRTELVANLFKQFRKLE